MLVLALVALFIVVPLVELYVIIQVGQQIGVLPTIGLLLLDSLLGSLLLRSQGRAAWRRFNEALRTMRPPAREVVDGLLIVVGGTLLLAPGFVTDVFGLVLLIPPTRALVRKLAMARLGRRLMRGMTFTATSSSSSSRRRGGDPRRRPRRPYDVEGTAVDIDPPPPLAR